MDLFREDVFNYRKQNTNDDTIFISVDPDNAEELKELFNSLTRSTSVTDEKNMNNKKLYVQFRKNYEEEI